jgi:hypothetical protein
MNTLVGSPDEIVKSGPVANLLTFVLAAVALALICEQRLRLPWRW